MAYRVLLLCHQRSGYHLMKTGKNSGKHYDIKRINKNAEDVFQRFFTKTVDYKKR